MAYCEVTKQGRLLIRRVVRGPQPPDGWLIRLKKHQVRLTVGQTAKVGPFELRMIDGAPPEVQAPAGGSSAVGIGAPGVEPPPSAPEDDDTARPPQIDGYRVTGKLGEGGMGTVWRAVQLGTDREVALKFLSAGQFGSAKSRGRFEREVKLAARLEHPNIARVYDSGLHRGVHYYAMELIDGVALDQYVADQQLSHRQILELMCTVSRAIDVAHAIGIVHRDLKPANILVGTDGQPHVFDFGLAKTSLEDDASHLLSIEGEVSGTPAYMSPEQAAGRHGQIDPRTDVYGLAAILFHLLVGRPPHDLAGSQFDVLRRIVEDDVVSPREISHEIDRRLDALLLKALSREPGERFNTAGELADAIEAYLRGDRMTGPGPLRRIKRYWRKRRTPILVVAVVLEMGVLALLAYFILSRGRPGGRPPRPNAPPHSLTRLAPIKAQAELVWARVGDLDGKQGFGELIDQAAATELEAKAAIDRGDYAAATKHYQHLFQQSQAISKREKSRRSALSSRDRAVTAGRRFRADLRVPAAKRLGVTARDFSDQAHAAFDHGQFDEAAGLWDKAAARCDELRNGAELLLAMGETHKRALERHGRMRVIQYAGSNWLEIQRGLREAEDAEASLDQAFQAWKRVQTLLTVVKEAVTSLEFDEALAAARKAEQAGKHLDALGHVWVALAYRPGQKVAARLKDRIEGGFKLPPSVTQNLGRGEKLRMSLVPAGTFVMGSAEDEPGRRETEGPQHPVVIGRPFYLSVTEVTRGQFAAFVRATQYETQAEEAGSALAWNGRRLAEVEGASWHSPGFEQTDNHPVVCVTYADATAFCDWLAKRIGGGRSARLPTEAEWEYACRAGTRTPYPWGRTTPQGQGWCNGPDLSIREMLPDRTTFDWTDGYVFTAPAGSFKANAWGLKDLSGNVWEWCRDWYTPQYHRHIANVDPPGPAEGTERLVRGGSALDGSLRCAARSSRLPDEASCHTGFRVAVVFNAAKAKPRPSLRGPVGPGPGLFDRRAGGGAIGRPKRRRPTEPTTTRPARVGPDE